MDYYVIYAENNIAQSVSCYDTEEEAIKEMMEFAKASKAETDFYNGLEDDDNMVSYVDKYGVNCCLTMLIQ